MLDYEVYFVQVSTLQDRRVHFLQIEVLGRGMHFIEVTVVHDWGVYSTCFRYINT